MRWVHSPSYLTHSKWPEWKQSTTECTTSYDTKWVLETAMVAEVNKALKTIKFLCKQSHCGSWAIDGRPRSTKQVSWIPSAPQSVVGHLLQICLPTGPLTIIVSAPDAVYAETHLIPTCLGLLSSRIIRAPYAPIICLSYLMLFVALFILCDELVTQRCFPNVWTLRHTLWSSPTSVHLHTDTHSTTNLANIQQLGRALLTVKREIPKVQNKIRNKK